MDILHVLGDHAIVSIPLSLLSILDSICSPKPGEGYLFECRPAGPPVAISYHDIII